MKRDLAALTERDHDLLVIGGGIHGAACFWDAAQRGLEVALVEASDFASGTSFNSLKTIHGGLRYLQKLDLPRMLQSIGDRSALLRIAPELVSPLPFVIPTYGHGRRGPEILGIGLRLNDLISFDRNRGLAPERSLPSGRRLSRQQVTELMPGVETRRLTGGALWYDAQVASSERLILALLRQAADAGGQLANYVEVTGFLRDGSRVRGVKARDLEAGDDVEIRAATVLVAAGPWTENLLALAGVAGRSIPLLRAVNLVVKRPLLARHALGAAAGSRLLFMVPWGHRTIIGTAYEPESQGSVAQTVESFLREASSACPWAELEPEDVTLVHCGLVPGERDASGLWTRDRVRDHARDDVPGLLSTLGVKFTTARAVAQQAIDLVFRRLGRPSPPCRTAETPLIHAHPLGGTVGERTLHAVADEMAVHLGDVVLRRIDLGTGGEPPEAEVDAVAARMADALDWTDDRLGAERRVLEDRLGLGRPTVR
jgi:glycerol-3-phosphate dehydrogenase